MDVAEIMDLKSPRHMLLHCEVEIDFFKFDQIYLHFKFGKIMNFCLEVSYLESPGHMLLPCKVEIKNC